MEARLSSHEAAIVVERDALRGDGGVEVGEGLETPVRDGLVDMDPKGLGGLWLWRVGRQRDEADALGHGPRPGAVCPRAPSSTRTMMRPRPAPASREKSASVSSKSALETPLERRQKLSPVAGETKAVT